MTTEIFPPIVLSHPATDPASKTGRRRDTPPAPASLPRGRGDFLDLDLWERGVAGRVPDRRGAVAALGRRLRRAAERHQPVAVGTLADPYVSRAGRTRQLLEACRGLGPDEGLALSLITRSPWVLRDLDLLVELDACHAISIEVPITAVDADLALRLEPDAPEPAERLAAVAALAAHGLATTVWCLPIVPGVNDGEEVLSALFAAAQEAGARDVAGSPLFAVPAGDDRLLPRLRRGLPGIARAIRPRGAAAEAAEARLAATFRRLRLANGFPRAVAGRG